MIDDIIQCAKHHGGATSNTLSVPSVILFPLYCTSLFSLWVHHSKCRVPSANHPYQLFIHPSSLQTSNQVILLFHFDIPSTTYFKTLNLSRKAPISTFNPHPITSSPPTTIQFQISQRQPTSEQQKTGLDHHLEDIKEAKR
jgi:hypothetical protein